MLQRLANFSYSSGLALFIFLEQSQVKYQQIVRMVKWFRMKFRRRVHVNIDNKDFQEYTSANQFICLMPVSNTIFMCEFCCVHHLNFLLWSSLFCTFWGYLMCCRALFPACYYFTLKTYYWLFYKPMDTNILCFNMKERMLVFK